MNNILSLIGNTLLLKKGPQDYPASNQWLMASTLLAIIFISGSSLLLPKQFSLIIVVISSATSILALLVYLKIALKMCQLQERFLQTATALVLINLAISLIVNLGNYFLLLNHFEKQNAVQICFAIIMIIWAATVNTYILKEAFNVNYLKGFLHFIGILVTRIVFTFILGLIIGFVSGITGHPIS